jgi:hypothetical protein
VSFDDDSMVGDFLGTPEARLERVERKLEPLDLATDRDAIKTIGVGPLETLFHQGHEDRLWVRIEHLARTDPRFRHALASTWAAGSTRFDDRQRLLRDLGEPTPTRDSI